MKLNERMRFPHPVLSKLSSDYREGEISAGFSHQQADGNQLKIRSTIEIDNTEISMLVSDQRAALGYFLVCRRTFFNYLQAAPMGISEKYFDLSLLHGLVTIRPVVWASKEITDFTSPMVDKEYGTNIRFEKGSIISMGPEFRFSVDPRKFKPFETIFSLAIDDSVPPGMIEVDVDQDKISILAEKETYTSISNMRNTDVARSVMLSSVFMPVIVNIVARVQSGDTSLKAKRWYQVFEAKCDDLGIQPDDESASPLIVAQQLLKAPLKDTAKALELTS